MLATSRLKTFFFFREDHNYEDQLSTTTLIDHNTSLFRILNRRVMHRLVKGVVALSFIIIVLQTLKSFD